MAYQCTHLSIDWLENYLREVAEAHKKNPQTAPNHAYCETGPCKPYHKRTIEAARRRGYKVEAFCDNTVFYVYPKEI